MEAWWTGVFRVIAPLRRSSRDPPLTRAGLLMEGRKAEQQRHPPSGILISPFAG